MAQTSNYALSWERVFGEKSRRGLISYLPSEAGAVIVQYHPDFRISALIAPATRHIEIEYLEQTFQKVHRSPSLILSQVLSLNSHYEPTAIVNAATVDLAEYEEIKNHFPWCYCQLCCQPYMKTHDYGRLRSQFYLFAVNDQDSQQEIMAQPYRLNNVYDDGKCCFGRRNSRASIPPDNLKQAHSRFWMDRFSPEFLPENWLSHRCNLRKHLCMVAQGLATHGDSHELDQCYCCNNICRCTCECRSPESFANRVANYVPDKRYENYTAIICGETFVSFPQAADAVFISSDPGLIESVPKKWVCKSPKFAESFIIGLAVLKDTLWEIRLGDVVFQLRTEQMVVV